MQLIWPNNLIRPNRVYRALAIFFLVFTAVDLTFPSLCQAEETAEVAQADAEKNLSGPVKDAPPDQPVEHSDFEEDCFCCCSHVIPSPHIGVSKQMQPPRIALMTLSSLPAAHPGDAFHPPRLS
jgi:hypothetical protein